MLALAVSSRSRDSTLCNAIEKRCHLQYQNWASPL